MAKPVLCVVADPSEPGPDLTALADRVIIDSCPPDRLGEHIGPAEIVLMWDFFSPALREAWPRAERLRWVHVPAAGVDAVLFDELVESEVVLTNARGVFDRPIAEYVLGAILAQAKRSTESLELQRQHRWHHRETAAVTGQRALVIGTGSIGREIARLLRAVGLQVSGAARRARSGDPDFDQVVSSADLVSVVGDFQQVIMVAPLTPATRNLIDADVLAAMAPDAHLINVGRGDCLDTDALVAALTAGRIGAATLDVVSSEPLPIGHPLWDLPSVVITPHLSGDVAGWRDRLAGQFRANVENHLSGRPLTDLVDKSLGFAAG